MDKDILILGGGPAGLSTALHLQQQAPEFTSRLLVLEKAHYPRPKLCAGGLVADAEILLERLNLDVREIPHTDAQSAHFDFRGRGISVSVPGSHTLRIIRRDEFDAWLAEKARSRGIEIREGVTVQSVRPDEDGVTVLTNQGEFRARVAVGADGSNGQTRRAILPGEPLYTARVLELLTPTYKDPSRPALEKTRGQVAFFEFSPVPQGIAGYTWDFPTQIGGQPKRCWGIYDANLPASGQRPALKETLAAEMKNCGLELADYELKGHPIRWFDPFTRMSVPRVLLVGDAVGADPIFGEGISMALGYGKVAATELAQAFKRENFSFTGYRQRVLTSPLGGTLLARWLLTYLIYTFRWSWFQSLLWRVLKPFVILVAWFLVLNWARRMR